MEVGPKDVKADGFVAVRRDTGDKIKMSRATAADEITKLLTTIQVWSLSQFFKVTNICQFKGAELRLLSALNC